MKEQPTTPGCSKTALVVLAIVALFVGLFGIVAVGGALLLLARFRGSSEIEPAPPAVAVSPAEQEPIDQALESKEPGVPKKDSTSPSTRPPETPKSQPPDSNVPPPKPPERAAGVLEHMPPVGRIDDPCQSARKIFKILQADSFSTLHPKQMSIQKLG